MASWRAGSILLEPARLKSDKLKGIYMFNYFPNNYAWSSTLVMGLMADGQFGEMHRWLEPLRNMEPDMEAWDKAWVGMAAQQEDLAATDLKAGYRLSAG